jgi:hypothetical protein
LVGRWFADVARARAIPVTVISYRKMKRQSLTSQKRKGPAPTGKSVPILVHIQPDKLAALDAYIAKEPDAPSRPEAIQRVLDGARRSKRSKT